MKEIVFLLSSKKIIHSVCITTTFNSIFVQDLLFFYRLSVTHSFTRSITLYPSSMELFGNFLHSTKQQKR